MQALASYPGPHWKTWDGLGKKLQCMAVRILLSWQYNNTCIMIYAWVHGIEIILWSKNHITKIIIIIIIILMPVTYIEFNHLRYWLFTISAMLTTKIINVTCTKMLKLAIMSPITSACSSWWHLVVSLWGSE